MDAQFVILKFMAFSIMCIQHHKNFFINLYIYFPTCPCKKRTNCIGNIFENVKGYIQWNKGIVSLRKKLINFPLTLGNYKNFFFFIMKGTCQNYFLRDYWILLLFFYAITLRCIYLVVMYGRHIYKRGLSVGIFNCMKPLFPILKRTVLLHCTFQPTLPATIPLIFANSVIYQQTPFVCPPYFWWFYFNLYSLLYHQFCRAFSQLEVAIPLLLYVMLFYTENI